MLIFRNKAPLTAYLQEARAAGQRIGFVPTMGALHEGHLFLVRAAAAQSDVVVVSIFVNPTQFNDPEDFKKYPVRTDTDTEKLLASPASVLFLPDVSEIYGNVKGEEPLEHYDFGKLETRWEGALRPGHFQGVGQVMARLLAAVPADRLFMGLKDYQQILIVKRLLALLSIKTELIPCPILREKDGLAMSSRNLRLSPAARRQAPLLHETLVFVRDHLDAMPRAKLIARAIERLEDAGFEVDYLALTGEDLEPVAAGDLPALCIVAAWLDGVRLIDNLAL